MTKFILKRVLLFIPVLLGVMFIVFSINRLTPGDPVLALLGSNYTQAQYDAKRAELGLDEPFFTQLYSYFKGVVTKLDLGNSYTSRRSVSTELFARIPVTMKLGLIGLVITVVIGVPCGIISATRQYSGLDYGVTIFSLFFASMPNFWLGLMLILLFSLRLHWFPATGIQTWRNWILPSLTLGLAPVANITRMTRSSMLEVIRQDYITTARSKGLTESAIIWKHAIRNAIIPVVTSIGFMLGMIVGGSVVVEAIFAIPGVGNLIMTAISNKDFPVIQGSILVVSLMVCIINLFVDIVYGFIDPRIKAQYQNPDAKRKRRQRNAAAEGKAA